MSSKKKSLSGLRKDIDAIDRELLELFSRRAGLALQVGEAKSEDSREVLDVGREKAVLDAVREANPGPLDDAAIEAIFQGDHFRVPCQSGGRLRCVHGTARYVLARGRDSAVRSHR